MVDLEGAPRILITTALDEDHLDTILGTYPDIEFRARIDRESAVEDDFSPHILLCDRLSAEDLERYPDLKWIQIRSAGVDHLPLDMIERRGIQLTNGKGAHGIPVAETALAMMFAFASGLPALVRAADRRDWIGRTVARSRFELDGQTLLVIGLGDLGATLARKARGLGMRVLGCDREPKPDLKALQGFVTVDQLDQALPQAHHVALCLPLTEDTQGIMSADRINRMRVGAYFYNVGRGLTVDHMALAAALTNGRLAGAGLDVTDPEPIPQDHPLWTLPNVLLTQHVGGASPYNAERITDLFTQNLHRFLQGVQLLNLVDPRRGY
ncbi:MAG: D-2-hydroxyacid dehydrogenase [Chthonomonadales bacterium]|nr:D-2-hydroxyacid dehydrogenase [Chthonomonadales bacterium]